MIDHTLLKADATRRDIQQLCSEAAVHRFAAVCVNPFWVPLAVACLEDQPVKVAATIGFPLGANGLEAKTTEARTALADGAAELDMVIAVGALRSGDWESVRNEINAVALIAHRASAVMKVILETGLLTQEEKSLACRTAVSCGADFVKTSTGFSSSGATVEDVRLLRASAGPEIGVKAAGGIRSLAALRAMVEAGANRIGTSAGVAIMDELAGKPDDMVVQPSQAGAY